MLCDVSWNDKVATLILGIFNPRRFMNPEGFPAWLAATTLFACLGLGLCEPLPEGLGMDFTWKYQALTALAAVLGWLAAAPLSWCLLYIFGYRTSLASLLRLACGASIVLVWTFPLSFLMRSAGSSAALSLAREFLFALVFVSAAAAPVAGTLKRLSWRILTLVAIVVASITLQMLPEWNNLTHLRMKDPGSGLVAVLRGEVPDGPIPNARWTLNGPQGPALEVERVSLGERQVVRTAREGVLVVEVHPGNSIGGDSGSLVTASPAAMSLAASVPEGLPEIRLHELHSLVRSRIAYKRTFFPGSVAEILERGSGDCKAYAQVFAEGAAALGFQARVVRGLLARPDGFWAHAWTSIRVDGKWQEWDPTSPIPRPDARYLRFSPPREAQSVFEGEMAIFALDSLRIEPLP